MNTAFTVSVDLTNSLTGISAGERGATIARLGHPDAAPEDFVRPGHVFPLRYREGGVLKRMGHTEAALDLSRLAGCGPAGVLCEIVNDADGSMAGGSFRRSEQRLDRRWISSSSVYSALLYEVQHSP